MTCALIRRYMVISVNMICFKAEFGLCHSDNYCSNLEID